MGLSTSDPLAVLGFPDNRKVCSSMTLFEAAGEGDGRSLVFRRVLYKFYGGKRDQATLDLLGR
jgi:uncharacterized protein (DUF1810 family)